MLAALSFLTIVGRGRMPGPGSLPYFPIVGLVVGALVGYTMVGALALWPPLVAAVLAVAVDALITGMLHLDGLTDSGDGLIAPMPRERRLEVMRDPRAGAFGVTTLVIVLLLRVAALTSSAPQTPGLFADWRGPAVVAAIWGLSRALMAATMTIAPYARTGGGLASVFRSDRARALGAAALAIGVACAVLLAELAAPQWVTPLVVTVVAFAAVQALAIVRLGGFTGDTLGAAGVVAETAGLLAVAAL